MLCVHSETPQIARQEEVLAARVCRHASKQEERETVGDFILTLDDTLSKVVVASDAGTLVRGMAKAVQGARVGPMHHQQLHLHALSRLCSDMEGGGATLGVHVVGVCSMDNKPKTRLKVAGTCTRMELLGEGGGGKGKVDHSWNCNGSCPQLQT